MKTAIGGDRLGSGNKENVSMRNYERSTHDLNSVWTSSMSPGTLVPFLYKLALPGSNHEIGLNANAMTLPTIGPLFGRYKIQLDVFSVPLRLYNAKLHMNKLNVGMDMSDIYLPQIELKTNNHSSYVQTYDDNEHINPSCLLKYLGISGLGHVEGITNPATREFNAVGILAYWDIFKNYYANKQEDTAYYIHTDTTSIAASMTPNNALVYDGDHSIIGNCLGAVITQTATCYCVLQFPAGAMEPDWENHTIGGTSGSVLVDAWSDGAWDDDLKTLTLTSPGGGTVNIADTAFDRVDELEPNIYLNPFTLTNIDDMREDILQYAGASAFVIDSSSMEPYSCFMQSGNGGADEALKYSMQYSQEGLAVKTYQSDLFNNWMDSDWIDGVDGINDITAIDTSGGEFTIDALNLAKKVYIMLNRIAISGGSYDDWIDAVYTHERVRGIDSPVYEGSLIKQLSFEEVVSQSASGEQPLGTLAGRGRMTDKHKGGRMNIKIHEPSVILGICSITPIICYSQGNNWFSNLKTFDDFHKPQLDGIGFQDLIAEQMHWADTNLTSSDGTIVQSAVGKQPAWINYMTEVDRSYGDFADRNRTMWMTLNRRYSVNPDSGNILDATTYIDPTLYNHIFADTQLDAQNFWMQIAIKHTARMKMSARIIPNL